MIISRFDQEITSEDSPSPETDWANRRSFIIRIAAATLSTSGFLAFLASCTGDDTDTIPTERVPKPSIPNPITELRQIPTPALPFPQQNIHKDGDPEPNLPTQPIEKRSFNIGKINEGAQINHLLRRAGFGIRPSELVHYRQIGLEKTLDHLVNFETVDNAELNSRLNNWNLKPSERQKDLRRWWILRMAYTNRPLEEKLVLFWHGLLTSGISTSDPLSMYQQNELFRTKGYDSYTHLLKAISKDPAMLSWLDSRKNKKAAPNENFSRELMELFTMGEGTFGESDVKEAARAFTGYFLVNGKFVFNDAHHDFGPKNFLSQSGYFSGDQIINVIFQQTETAEYISKKLFTFFVHNSPTIQTIEKLSAILRANNYNIKTLMENLLSSEEFYSPRAYRSKIKSPAEFTIGLIRNTGAETDGRKIANLMSEMGQTLFEPPDVAGWPDGITWISSNTMIQRLNYVHSITLSNLKGTHFNPHTSIVPTHPNSPDGFLKGCLETMLDGNINPSSREILMTQLRTLENLTDQSGEKVFSNEEIMRQLAFFVLASPEFQLN